MFYFVLFLFFGGLLFFIQILMYESSSWTVLQWVTAVLCTIPDQAVKFDNCTEMDAMFVARVYVHSLRVGAFTSSHPCAEYYRLNRAQCANQFEFLVLKHSESAKTLQCPANHINSYISATMVKQLIAQYVLWQHNQVMF